MQTSSVTQSPAANSASALSSSTAVEQQDRFMTLLVAQMKNQDPLNPMDNAQMTSQIAQINTVSGIEKLNRTVETMLGGFYALQAQGATQLPGRTVMVPGSGLTLADGASRGGIELAGAADAVKVDIVDAGGALVQTLQLGKSPAGVRQFSWDGSRADGGTAAPGDYKMRVSATAGDKPVQAAALTAATVHSISNGSAGLQVDLGEAGIHFYADIKSFL